jgi:hypothetical protein
MFLKPVESVEHEKKIHIVANLHETREIHGTPVGGLQKMSIQKRHGSQG